MTNLTPVEALQREIVACDSMVGMNKHWRIHIAALELAKADADLAYENHLFTCDCNRCVRRNLARKSLYEALKQ